MKNFKDIEYLKNGTVKQKSCYRVLREINILDILRNYDPIVVGTIPISVDIKNSDIDIICYGQNLFEIQNLIKLRFSSYNAFSDKLDRAYVANFEYAEFLIEIYAEPTPTLEQNGYRHMLVEDRILRLMGNQFRQEIIRLKLEGYKTEPAFGELLKLDNPYLDLLKLESLTDEELKSQILANYKV